MKRHCLKLDERRHRIGVASFDRQHRELVEKVNRIAQAIDGDYPAEALDASMDELLQLARQHFEFEQRPMVKRGFPGVEEHCREHSRLLKRLVNLSAPSCTSDPHKVKFVPASITDWAESHLYQGEKVLGEYLACKELN